VVGGGCTRNWARHRQRRTEKKKLAKLKDKKIKGISTTKKRGNWNRGRKGVRKVFGMAFEVWTQLGDGGKEKGHWGILEGVKKRSNLVTGRKALGRLAGRETRRRTR